MHKRDQSVQLRDWSRLFHHHYPFAWVAQWLESVGPKGTRDWAEELHAFANLRFGLDTVVVLTVTKWLFGSGADSSRPTHWGSLPTTTSTPSFSTRQVL